MLNIRLSITLLNKWLILLVWLAVQVIHFFWIPAKLDWSVGGDDSSLDEVEKAVETKKLVLFPQSRFDDSMLILELMFPENFKDCSYSQKVNTSALQSNHSTQHSKCEDSECPSLYGYAGHLPWIKKDEQLYKLACHQLPAYIEECTDLSSDFIDQKILFDDRCKKRRTQNSKLVSHGIKDSSVRSNLLFFIKSKIKDTVYRSMSH